jgi:hypothetical protein
MHLDPRPRSFGCANLLSTRKTSRTDPALADTVRCLIKSLQI